MKIGIDISQIIYGTGVSVYTKELVKNLVKLDHEDKYILFGGSIRRQDELREFVNSLPEKLENKIVPLSPSFADILWNRLHIMPIENFIGKVDIFHTSDWAEPPAKALKVTTIHDLSPIIFEKETNPKIVSIHKRKLRWVKKESNAIIVPSEATKKDLVELGFEKNKIFVIPEAPNPNLIKQSEESDKKTLNKFSIFDKYILAIGTQKRKNLERVYEAFERCKAEFGLKHMVVVGTKHSDFGFKRGVIMTGYVSDEELSILFSNAEALVYASLYEGFGLPILEAFKLGCPVVTSNISSMREVAGDAAILCDPLEIESITEGVSEALKNRDRYKKAGRNRVGKFSWENNAKETLKVYKNIK